MHPGSLYTPASNQRFKRMIYVTNLIDMPEHARTLRPSHLVSLVEAIQQPQTPPDVQPERHLRLEIDDIWEPAAGQVLPGEDHLRRLLAFIETWRCDAPLLVHCVAGVSRSTAAALIALTVKCGTSEAEAARRLRRAAPHAQPNRRLIALADRLLQRDGRLVAACESMGPANLTTRGPLVELALNETFGQAID